MKTVTSDVVHIVPGLDSIEKHGVVRVSELSGLLEWFNGSEWEVVAIGDAPANDKSHARRNNEWTVVTDSNEDIDDHINNTDIHLTSNEKTGLQNANNLSGSNPVITVEDLNNYNINGGYF